MGKMDNPEYVEKAVRKIESYEKNDLFSGEKMLLTFESTRHPLNSRTIERMILKYLI